MTAGEGTRQSRITIYSRPGCHLCDEMKAVVVRALKNTGMPICVEDVDVSTDPALEARYGQEVPVLTIDGRKAAKYRVTESEITRMLQSRARPAEGAGPAGGAGGLDNRGAG
ncbi:MAG TPA: glutaredoxin family protein [Vicinamibacterales bacterium]|nr:glutaredoxin family protein [Vicinamibacterales bacterium]